MDELPSVSRGWEYGNTVATKMILDVGRYFRPLSDSVRYSAFVPIDMRGF